MDFEGGFFNSEDLSSGKPLPRISGCGACKLYKECLSPRMEVTGKGGKRILILAEAPGATEDKRNEQLVGDAGKILRNQLRRLGIDLDEDCRKTNALICRPPGNRTPTDNEIECCRPNLLKELKENPPHLIIPLGESAVKSLIGHRWHKGLGGITKWRGWTIPDRDLDAWVCPTFHPSYILRMGSNPAVEKIFEEDLARAISLVDVPVAKFVEERGSVDIITNPKELYKQLQALIEWRTRISFDYETTGLKPHYPGHKIVTCAIATSDKCSFAFKMPQHGKLLSIFRQVMMDPRIPKLAHNIKYEDNWTNEIVGVPVEGWEWDSMLAAHILDNREGITGLKFQTYVRFGLIDYDSHIESFLVSDRSEMGANGFNNIHKAPIRDVLIYNGIDSLVGFRLAILQMKELGYDPPFNIY